MRHARQNRWQGIAAKLAAAIPRERLDAAVLSWADAPERVSGSWHVAFSGGADSLAVLLLVWAHWPARRRRLRAVHFDHRLRGAESTADAAFCRRVCDALGVRLTVGVWHRSDRGPVSEAEARAARMAFFEKYTKALWLGHHQDDVAETLLMRLARGSGSGGLSAPRPVQEFPGYRVHLRPLLTLRKAEIVAALSAAGARWREDATNPDGRYFRNRIRADVVGPWVAAAQRDAVAGAARSRELLAEDDAALEAWVDRLCPIGKSGALLLSRLVGAPRAVVRRALHRWLLRCRPKVDLSRQAFEKILSSVESGKPTRHSIGSERFAVLRKGRLTLDLGNRRRKFQPPVN